MNFIFRKKNRYHVIKITDQNDGIRYGIASETDPNIFVLDISTDRKFVTQLNRKCNKGNLSPLHLVDVVEDELP